MPAPTTIESAAMVRCPRCQKMPNIASAHDCLECSMRLLDRILPTMGEPATLLPFQPRTSSR